MLLNGFVYALLAVSSIPAHGWPHMAQLKNDLTKRLAQNDNNNDGDGPGELIGDLKKGATTSVGRSIANILTGKESAQSKPQLYIPAPYGTFLCKLDTCCVWWWVSQTLTKAFTGPTGRCNDLARSAIRLGFHDAGTWSKNLASKGQDFGGADGSIFLSGVEKGRPENRGLEGMIDQAGAWAKQYGVGVADMIQFAANHAVVTCPLGPRVRTFVGRKDSTKAAPDGLLPDVNDSADNLISLFQDKTISPHMLTALLGAHSTSRQFFVDPSKAGQPQDSTPGVWDTAAFYNETLLPQAPKGVFRFASDLKLSVHPKIHDEWIEFTAPNGVGQKHWNEDYAAAYVRLSLLGVNNINGKHPFLLIAH